MNKYEFSLAPAYCLFNGVAVCNQKGRQIKFLIEHIDDVILKERLKRAFCDYLENIKAMKKVAKEYEGDPKIEFEKATRNLIRKYVSGLYAVEDKKKELAVNKNDNDTGNRNDEAAAVLLLDRILNEGRQKKATDIHIENKSVRFRINGKLEYQMKVTSKRMEELIQRIKLLGGMNVLDKRNCQDGNFVYGNKKPLFVRVSTVSVVGEDFDGTESVVLRLLDTSRIPLSIDYLGFNLNQLERINSMEDEKHGLVLVCGPTGSGKSTTVASMLVELQKKNNGCKKIISLEDPPEYFIPGVTQIKVENGFKESLDHIFRLDPDVIMIGEIRDELSAAAALKAALTGHLVIATLHTGSVSESILRMENLGLDRIILSSVLKGVICQELNYVGEEIKLYGDIGVPIKNFGKKISYEMSEEELESLFIHETNYSEIFSKTLEIFNKKDSEIKKREKRIKRLWRETNRNGKIYKNIV